MSKRARILLFLGLFVLFLVLGTATIAYSQGFRFSVRTFTFQKVGAIYIRSFPSNVNIELNGKPVQNDSWLLQRGTLINNLFPKPHQVVLELQGYKTWSQTVAVRPSLVSELNALLIPTDSTEVAGAGVPLKNFWRISQAVLYQDESNALNWRGAKIQGANVIGWTDDGKKLLTSDSAKKTYFWVDLTTGSSTNLTSALKKIGEDPSVFGLLPDPHDNQKVLLIDNKRIALFDIQRGVVATLAEAGRREGAPAQKQNRLQWSKAIASSRNNFAFSEFNAAQGTSTIIVINKSSRRAEYAPSLPLRGKTLKMEWISGSELMVLQDDGELYRYQPSTGEVRPFASDVKDFALNTERTMAATLGRSAIEIFSFRDKDEYWRFAPPQASAIKKLLWHKNSDHLFVVYPERTRLLDLTDTALENFQEVAGSSLVEYDEEGDVLYFLKSGRVRQLFFKN
jgi:hypothetical protein